MPTICVYVATHNRVAMLRRALQSILVQTVPATEIIVVDDGSTDGTTEFMQQFCSQHRQCLYIRNETSQGACIARNRAIEQAKAEFITGLDDDDEFLPDHLECLWNAFSPDKACVASSLLENSGTGLHKRSLDTGTITLDSLLHYNKLGNQVFTLTERLKAVGGFDEKFPAFQDYDTWVRLLQRYGAAEKLASTTYIWHTSHEQERISHSQLKRLAALTMFKRKYMHLLKKRHLASLEVMRIRIAGDAFPLYLMLKLINVENWKAALALYMNTNFKALKRRVDTIRR